MQCPHYLGRKDYIIHCKHKDFDYTRPEFATNRIKKFCNADYCKCTAYKKHRKVAV